LKDSIAAHSSPAAGNRTLCDLASVLSARSGRLPDRHWDVDEKREACVAMREAVSIWRGLAERDPSRFEPVLARNLGIFSDRALACDDRKDAIDAIADRVADL
jgi:hypothetical protein